MHEAQRAWTAVPRPIEEETPHQFVSTSGMAFGCALGAQHQRPHTTMPSSRGDTAAFDHCVPPPPQDTVNRMNFQPYSLTQMRGCRGDPRHNVSLYNKAGREQKTIRERLFPPTKNTYRFKTS